MFTGSDLLEEKINKTMVGRGPETELFKKQFDRVLEGCMGVSLVSGQPGIGKSFFVERAAGMLAGVNATYVHGKCRQYDASPLIAFSEIIEQIIRHILTLPAEALKNIKNDLNRKLGADARLILSLCPYAGILFETHKAGHTDNLEQMKYKVRKAIYDFITTASTALFPLIIFIDDLQWADTLSLSIIETLCQDYEYLNLYLVLAWRDNETGRPYLNPAKLPDGDDLRIELGGLKPSDIDQYIRHVFEQDIEHKDYLIRALFGLTLGNPFNITRVLRLFLYENAVDYSPSSKKWLIRSEKMDKLNLPADIEELLSNQLDALSDEDRELLGIIACASEASAALLHALAEGGEELLGKRLDILCKSALLEKNNSGGTTSYAVAHDVVLRLIHNALSGGERSEIHFKIAEALYKEQVPPLQTARHLMSADAARLIESGAEKWINVLYDAGVEAKQGAAGAEQALEFFERCAELLFGCKPEETSRLSLDVLLELLECRFICGQTEDAKKGFEALILKHPETTDQIKIKRKYINLCAFIGDYEKAMEMGIQILACLNFKLDPKHLIPDLIKSRLLFSDKNIERLESAPAITDTRLLCILEILTLMAPLAKRGSDKMAAMIALKLAILSGKYGNSEYAPVAYASYCYFLFHILKDHKKGKRLEDVALSLIKRCESSASNYVALCILGSLTHHWTNPFADTADYLENAIEEGEKEGSSLYSSYAITFAIATKYMTGTPLEELTQYITDCRNKQSRLEHYLASFIYDGFENHIRWLKGGVRSEEKVFSEEYRYKTMYADVIEMNDDMIALQQLYLGGQTEKAWRLAEDIAPRLSPHPEYTINVESFFYSVLTRIAWHQALTGAEKRRNKILIKKQFKELRHWVSVYPGNHRARYLLALAEYDALLARGKYSDKRYREAMDFAERQGNLPLEALANLLSAKYHSDNHKLSRFYAAEAINLYKKWGAYHLGDLIAESMGLADKADRSEAPTSLQAAPDMADSGKKAERDILFHLDKMEQMSEDEGYLYFLDVLIRQEDADYCAVYFEKSDEMYLKYEKRKGSETRAHRDLINMNHLSSLPHKVIRYVARTETEIVLSGKTGYGIFTSDPYLKENDALSIICLPIRYSGVLIGIIYIKKSGTDGFCDTMASLAKGFLPFLLSRQTTIREMSVQKSFNPSGENSLLTEREFEVLKLVAQGLSNAEISGNLHITLGTVKNHLRNIYAKLETDNRVKAVMRAKELKIIQP